MKITPTNESLDETSVYLNKNYSCPDCHDTKELNNPQWDLDSHQFVDTGDTKPCYCALDIDTYEPETI